MSETPPTVEPTPVDVRPPTSRHKVWPLLAVIGVLVIVVMGGYVTAAALSTPAGPPITIGRTVRVRPLSGWAIAPRICTPGVRLTRGSGTLDVCDFGAFPGSVTQLAAAYVSQVLEHQAESGRLSTSPRMHLVQLGAGIVGVRFGYVGLFPNVQGAIEGEVTAVVTPSGAGVIFDGWAPQGILDYVSGDINTMIETARMR